MFKADSKTLFQSDKRVLYSISFIIMHVANCFKKILLNAKELIT